MEVKKALYISQEIAPYLDESAMANWGRDLPQGIKERGAEVRAFMPKYGYINERRNQLHEVFRLSGMNIIIDDTDHPLIIKTATMLPSRISVFFIYNDDYFTQAMTKELETTQYSETNDERSIFYVRAIIEALRKQRWTPDVIQCSGWITALAPVYMRELYPDDPSFRDAKIIYELWDDAFENPMSNRMARLLCQDGISESTVQDIYDQPVSHTALTRLALQHSDAVIQCSPHVSPELIELAQASGLPFLPYSDDEDRVETVAKFYKSL